MGEHKRDTCEHDWHANGPTVERYFICRKCSQGEYRRPWWQKWFVLRFAVWAWRDPVFRFLGLAFVAVLYWVWWVDNEERKECERVGGRMVQTGTQTLWVYNHATKTSAPQELSIIECVSRTPMGSQP